MRILIFSILFLWLGSACSFFGSAKNSGRFLGYHQGLVKTKNYHYYVGILSDAWKRKTFSNAALTFHHAYWQASISTQSYCDDAISDIPLEFLIKDLYYGLKNLKVEKTEELILDGREARHALFSGLMDGVPVKLDAVSVKKNLCLIDFYLVSPATHYREAQVDFRGFYEKFRLIEVK